MRPERRFKGRNGTGRPSIAALKTSNPRPRRTLAYCGRKMVLTMGTTLEIIAIQLEDIDWRAGEILIRGKGKLHDRMPLPADAGEAIVDYIRNARVGNSRALFVSARAPYRAFQDAQIVDRK